MLKFYQGFQRTTFKLEKFFLATFFIRLMFFLGVFHFMNIDIIAIQAMFGDFNHMNRTFTSSMIIITSILAFFTIFAIAYPKTRKSLLPGVLILIQSAISPLRVFINIRSVFCFKDQKESILFNLQYLSFDHIIIGGLYLIICEVIPFALIAVYILTYQIRFYLKGSVVRKYLSEIFAIEILIWLTFVLLASYILQNEIFWWFLVTINVLVITLFLTSKDGIGTVALLTSFCYVFLIVYVKTNRDFLTSFISFLALAILLLTLKAITIKLNYSVEDDLGRLFSEEIIEGNLIKKFLKDLDEHAISCNVPNCDCQLYQKYMKVQESLDDVLPHIKRFYYNNQLKIAESGVKVVLGLYRSCFLMETIVFECDLLAALSAHKGFYHKSLCFEISLSMNEKLFLQKMRFLHTEERFLPLLEKELSIQNKFFDILNILKDFSEKSFSNANVSKIIDCSNAFNKAVEATKKELAEEGLPRKEILSLLLSLFFEKESGMKPQNILLAQNKMSLNVNQNSILTINKIVFVFKHKSMVPIYSIGRVFPKDVDKFGRLSLIPKPFEAIHKKLIQNQLPYTMKDQNYRPFFLENEKIFKYICFLKRNFISSSMEALMVFNAISKQHKNSRHWIYGVFDQNGNLLTHKMRDKTKFKFISVTLNQNYLPFFSLLGKFGIKDWQKCQELLFHDIILLRQCLLALILQIGFFDQFTVGKEFFFLRFKVIFEQEGMTEKLFILEIISISKFKMSKFVEKIHKKLLTYISKYAGLNANISDEIRNRLLDIYKNLINVKTLHGLSILIENITNLNYRPALSAIRALSLKENPFDKTIEHADNFIQPDASIGVSPGQTVVLRKNILNNLQRFTPRHFRGYRHKPPSKCLVLTVFFLTLASQITFIIVRNDHLKMLVSKETLWPSIVSDSLHFMTFGVYSTALTFSARINNIKGNFTSSAGYFTYWHELMAQDYGDHYNLKFNLYYFLHGESFPNSTSVINMTSLLLAFTNATLHHLNIEKFAQSVSKIDGQITQAFPSMDVFRNLTYMEQLYSLDHYVRNIISNTKGISQKHLDIELNFFMIALLGMLGISCVSFLFVFFVLVKSIKSFNEISQISSRQETSAKITSDNLQFIELITRILLKIEVPDISKKYKYISLFEFNNNVERKESKYFRGKKFFLTIIFLTLATIFGSFLVICFLFQRQAHNNMLSSVYNYYDNGFFLKSQTKMILLVESFQRKGIFQITDQLTNLDIFSEESKFFKDWFNSNLNNFETFFPYQAEDNICNLARISEDCDELIKKYASFSEPIPKFLGILRLMIEDEMICNMKFQNLTENAFYRQSDSLIKNLVVSEIEFCNFYDEYIDVMRNLFVNFYIKNKAKIDTDVENFTKSYTKLGSFTQILLISLCAISSVLFVAGVVFVRKIVGNVEDLVYIEHFYGSRFLTNVLSSLVNT